MSMIFWPYFTRIYLLLLLDKKMDAVAPYFPILLIQPYIIFAHTIFSILFFKLWFPVCKLYKLFIRAVIISFILNLFSF